MRMRVLVRCDVVIISNLVWAVAGSIAPVVTTGLFTFAALVSYKFDTLELVYCTC